METEWIALAVKMATTAAIVVTTCLVVERAGPLLGAVVASLPVSSGPAYVFLAAEHGAAFIAASVPASLASLAASAGFIVVYGALAQKRGGLASTLAALITWTIMVTVLRAVAPGLGAAALATTVIYVVCLRLVTRWRRAAPIGEVRSSPWDIPARAAAAMLLVASVIVAGRLLGPGAAGELALAPVVLTRLALLLHPRLGGPAAAAVMVNTLPGLFGMAVAAMVLGVTARPWGANLSLLLALAICLTWNAGVLFLARANWGWR